MSIKNKITPELKKKFREEIRKTVEDGKEHGFILHKKDDKLFPGKSCEGEECEILLESYTSTQGEFHTHSWISMARNVIKKSYPEEEKRLTNDEIKNIILNSPEYKYSVELPSHGDLLNSIISKCQKISTGITCIGNDIKTDTIQCWTPIENKISLDDCFRASIERKTPLSTRYPQKWIKPLFEVENINIKNDDIKKNNKNFI